jgi:hypothetical protein
MAREREKRTMMTTTKIGEPKSLYINLATEISSFDPSWLGKIQQKLDNGEISSFVVLVHGKNHEVPANLTPFAVYPLEKEKLVDFIDRVCRSHRVTHFVSLRKTILKHICMSTLLTGVRVGKRATWNDLISWLFTSNPEYYPTMDAFDHRVIGK